MYDTKPELIGIYNNGVKGGGGGGTGIVSITIPPASLTTPGVVITGNTANPQLTSDTVNVVPTQWYFQQEVSRLDNRIDSAGVIQYTKIAQYPPEN